MTQSILFPDDLLQVGTKVFIPRPMVGQVAADEILGYFGQITKQGENLQFVPSDYQLNSANLERGGSVVYTGWKSDEFFLSYDEALTMAKIYQVIVSPENAYRAIGYEEEYNYEAGYSIQITSGCELDAGCAAIDQIRWIIAKAINQTYITAIGRQTLAELLKCHEPPVNCEQLRLILAQMDLTW